MNKSGYKRHLQAGNRDLVKKSTRLIAAHTILLYQFGMGFFDAVCHSFSTIATSGFSTKNLNIAHYNSVAIELVILFFMLISSMHFGLIYATMTLKKTILLLPVPYGCTCLSWHS